MDDHRALRVSEALREELAGTDARHGGHAHGEEELADRPGHAGEDNTPGGERRTARRNARGARKTSPDRVEDHAGVDSQRRLKH